MLEIKYTRRELNQLNALLSDGQFVDRWGRVHQFRVTGSTRPRSWWRGKVSLEVPSNRTTLERGPQRAQLFQRL